MIRGYPRYPSLFPGEDLTLHVSTDQNRFRIGFYRVGRGLERADFASSRTFVGHDYPPGPTDQDWAWPPYTVAIPADWRPGCYVAAFVAIDEDGREYEPDLSSADGVDSKAFFVVRNPRPGVDTRVLYKVSWATFHAYNATGYGSLYQEAQWSPGHPDPGFKVTTRRPGGGTGGVVMMGDSPDYYDLSSRRQTFAHWDEPFIRWLEENDYVVDFCTDWDVHRDSALLESYNLLLSVGHDEYWSDDLRDNIDAFVNNGGNVAYFSGNIDGWRIHFHDGDTAFTCAKAAPPVAAPTSSVLSAADGIGDWIQDSNQTLNPENRTTGVSYYIAGGWWDGKRETLGYTVQHADHWVYAGTGLRDGDVFGDDEELPLIGYECDGAHFQMRRGFAFPTGAFGTPSSFVILGLAKLGPGWRTYHAGAAATMGAYTSAGGGIVFQGATTDWPKVVARNSTVAQVTRNVIDTLSLRSVRVLGPMPGHAGRAVAEAGQVAVFTVDASSLPTDHQLTYEWRLSGAVEPIGDEPIVRIRVPVGQPLVTVTVSVTATGKPTAFGSCSFAPLTHEEALQLEIVTLLRDMVTPGDPSGSFVVLTSDPVLVSRGIVTVNLPYIATRAERLASVTAELLGLWSRDGRRPVVDDPRVPWVPSQDR